MYTGATWAGQGAVCSWVGVRGLGRERSSQNSRPFETSLLHACVRSKHASYIVRSYILRRFTTGRLTDYIGRMQLCGSAIPHADVDATLEDASVPHVPPHSLTLTLTHWRTEYAGRLSNASAPTQLPSQLPSLRNYSAAPPTGLTVASPPLPQDPPHSPWHSRLQLHSVVPLQTKFALTIWITLARGLKRGRRQGTVLTANETVDVAGDVAGLPLSLW